MTVTSAYLFFVKERRVGFSYILKGPGRNRFCSHLLNIAISRANNFYHFFYFKILFFAIVSLNVGIFNFSTFDTFIIFVSFSHSNFKFLNFIALWDICIVLCYDDLTRTVREVAFFTKFFTCTEDVTDLQSKSMDWFLYDRDLRHERVKLHTTVSVRSICRALSNILD